jgi:hypothetical protein
LLAGLIRSSRRRLPCLKRAARLIDVRSVTGLMNADREFHGILTLEQSCSACIEQLLRF